MKFESYIDYNAEISGAYEILLPEAENRKRSKISVKKVGRKIKFTISAEDLTAFRASFGNVLKTITILEKTDELIKNDRGKNKSIADV
ncbi:hypothetical protein J4401_04480 [Candidatus Woesearchaeota archaeon]|nr:hypothetical protein [Candidatus Woesearchaeota archaeon]